MVLFGDYPWTIDKKTVIQGNVSELFPDVPWIYNKKGELKKENFDASDAYVACLGYLNKEKYGELDMRVENIQEIDKGIKYDVVYWNKRLSRITYCDKK